MKKTNFIIISIFIALVIIFVSFFLSLINKQPDDLSLIVDNRELDLILFSGEGCVHCATVIEYINDNNLKDKLGIRVKEVYNNPDDAELFEEKFNKCIPTPYTYGIPLLWDNNFCLIGPVDIIDYLRQL